MNLNQETIRQQNPGKKNICYRNLSPKKHNSYDLQELNPENLDPEKLVYVNNNQFRQHCPHLHRISLKSKILTPWTEKNSNSS